MVLCGALRVSERELLAMHMVVDVYVSPVNTCGLLI